MRLFVFAIGGTGSRVIKSLAMLCAAGVRPVDPATGAPMENVEIVPIIVDPHQSGNDVKRTVELLRDYVKIRRALYADTEPADGFFATKISTLKSLSAPGGGPVLADTFLFNMSAVERMKFSEFIDYNELGEENQAMMQMLFSASQLDTSMRIGFVGAPNIGSVALNRFKDSEEFKAFGNIISEGDRIFFISSIFGGTGAAGFPIMVKNIRQSQNADMAGLGYMRMAKIGALTVLPYFNIEHSATSAINKADFLVKTRSALHYYDKALTASGRSLVNSIYYLGDREVSTPYTNDPGEGGQKNAAHLIELVGALSVFDFMSRTDDELAERTEAFEYGLERDTTNVDMLSLAPGTRALIARPMLRLHLLSLFLDRKMREVTGRGFTKDTPVINRDFLSSDVYTCLTQSFFPAYWDWLEEMEGNHRHVVLFDLDNAGKLERVVHGVEPRKGVFGHVRLSQDDIFARINAVSKKYNGKFAPDRLLRKLLFLFHEAVSQLIDSKFPVLNEPGATQSNRSHR